MSLLSVMLAMFVVACFYKFGGIDSIVDATIFCRAGAYLVPGTHDEPDKCYPCPSGSFNEGPSHRQTSCQSCTPFNEENPYIQLVSECTSERDTVIKCSREGLYLNEKKTDCLRCTDCKAEEMFEVRACSSHSDATCCPRPDMHDEFGKCVDRPINCSSGTYLVSGENGEPEYCHPCYSGSFNSLKSHRRKACTVCNWFNKDEPFIELVANCTPHHDTIIKCSLKDFHLDIPKTGCLPCTECKAYGLQEVSPCTDEKDARCCPKQSMIVRDGECVEPDVFCGPGEYLTQDVQHGDTCRLCPENTTNYESNHKLTSCHETCLSLPDMEKLEGRSQVFSREMQCEPNERLIGKSCSSGDTLLCRPRPPQSSTQQKSTIQFITKETVPAKTSEHHDSIWDTFSTILVSHIPIVIFMIVSLIAICVPRSYQRLRTWCLRNYVS